MDVRLVVLDMVGTTVEAGDEVPFAFREAFRRVGLELTDDEVTHVRGRSKVDAIAALVAARLPDHPDAAQVCRDVYASFQEVLRGRYETSVCEVPGAASALTVLRAAGVQVALTTGLDRETVDGLLRGLGWESSLLSAVVTADEVQRGRPAPDLIQAAMRLTGITDPGRVLAVGDTTADLDAGAAAGVRWNVGVLSGAHSRAQLSEHPHTLLLDSVVDLPVWLVEVGALGASDG